MNIGYACINLSITNGSPNKRVTYKRFQTLADDEKRAVLYDKSKQNMDSLRDIVRWNAENNVKAYRISSDIFPLTTHPSVIGWWNPTEVFAKELNEIGEIANKYNQILSLHPGQFTILSSSNEELTKKSIDELNHHYNILNALNLNYIPVINIHGGGKYGDYQKAKSDFISNWEKVPDKIKNLITLENDQHIYNPDEILELCEKLKIPMVFDIAHWEWNKGSFNNVEDGLMSAFKTWPKNRIKKVHVSSQKPGVNKHAHADYIEEKDLRVVLNFAKKIEEDFTIMLECKMKNKALEKLVEDKVI